MVSVQLGVLLLSFLGVPLLRDPYSATEWLIGTLLGAVLVVIQVIATRLLRVPERPVRGKK
jgi:hypothetical protein